LRVLTLALSALASYALTGLVLRLATSRGWLDVPNARSSHQEPTPRGGGVAIVACGIFGLIAGWAAGWVTAPQAIGLGGGGLLVAVVGWLDDRFTRSPLHRLGVHFLAAVWAVYSLGGLGTEVVHGISVRGWVLNALAVLAIVWATNLYNFMDGIDGIAAGEGLSVGAFAGLLLLFKGENDLAFIAGLLAAVSAGFLVWNWSPAHIFMGDVGSGFLGFAFGSLAIAAEKQSAGSLLYMLLLAGVFVFDATITLLRRALHRERIHAAHRRHAYQRIAQAGFSHSQVSAFALALNAVLGGLVLLTVGFAVSKVLVAAACLLVLTVFYLLVERRAPMYATKSGR
jgi:Fuc2NAc and GlcNAc transferase